MNKYNNAVFDEIMTIGENCQSGSIERDPICRTLIES